MPRFFPSIWTALLTFALGFLAAEVARPLLRQAPPPHPPVVTEAPPARLPPLVLLPEPPQQPAALILPPPPLPPPSLPSRAQPHPGEWWMLNSDAAPTDPGPGPWPGTSVLEKTAALAHPICLYVREVTEGWVRYYQNDLAPDHSMPAENFATVGQRSTAAACADTHAGQGLRCPPGEDLVGVNDVHQPVCRQP